MRQYQSTNPTAATSWRLYLLSGARVFLARSLSAPGEWADTKGTGFFSFVQVQSASALPAPRVVAVPPQNARKGGRCPFPRATSDGALYRPCLLEQLQVEPFEGASCTRLKHEWKNIIGSVLRGTAPPAETSILSIYTEEEDRDGDAAIVALARNPSGLVAVKGGGEFCTIDRDFAARGFSLDCAPLICQAVKEHGLDEHMPLIELQIFFKNMLFSDALTCTWSESCDNGNFDDTIYHIGQSLL